jgi:transposase-like protein
MLIFAVMTNEKSGQAEMMRMHIEGCKESGKTIEDYCKEHDLKPSNYYYWRKKLSSQESGKFVRIAAEVTHSSVTVIFVSGHRMVFETLPSVEYIKQLVG